MVTAASAVLVGALSSTRLSAEEQEFIREIAPAGITLFSRNIASLCPVTSDSPGSVAPQAFDAVQLQALTASIQKLRGRAAPPCLIAIDQEGGRVARLKHQFPNLGPALQLADGLADSQAQDALYRYGADVGRGLSQLGINVNFAPVLDVKQDDTHDSIGDRAFGNDPETVVVRAGAFMRGMQATGVLGCLKHFPGQGSARSDTHLQSATVAKSLAELNACDLLPFKKLMPEARMVMLGHCIYPCLDQREASLSSVIIEELLRTQLGFSGVAVSDDLTMKAVHKSEADFGDLVVTAVERGIDLLLICKELHLWQQAYAALSHQARESAAFRKKLELAAERVTTLRGMLL